MRTILELVRSALSRDGGSKSYGAAALLIVLAAIHGYSEITGAKILTDGVLEIIGLVAGGLGFVALGLQKRSALAKTAATETLEALAAWGELLRGIHDESKKQTAVLEQSVVAPIVVVEVTEKEEPQ